MAVTILPRAMLTEPPYRGGKLIAHVGYDYLNHDRCTSARGQSHYRGWIRRNERTVQVLIGGERYVQLLDGRIYKVATEDEPQRLAPEANEAYYEAIDRSWSVIRPLRHFQPV